MLNKINMVVDRLKWKFIIPKLADKRRSSLKTDDFTIISNNCWGGKVYEYFNIPKKTPTVGLYFFAEDYVKLCSNLKYYLSQDISFINFDNSRHKTELIRRKEQNAIIGKLQDIEIVFLHYHDKKTILEKWKRRIDRINWNHVILKFSYQNNCNDDLIKQFLNISEYKKICFIGKLIDGYSNDDLILFPKHKGKETVDETTNMDSSFDLISLINSKL